MASLYIKDAETAAIAARLAKRLGTTKTEAVSRALQAFEAGIDIAKRDRPGFAERLRNWREANPPLQPTGLTADKAFSDWLCGEEDVIDPFR